MFLIDCLDLEIPEGVRGLMEHTSTLQGCQLLVGSIQLNLLWFAALRDMFASRIVKLPWLVHGRFWLVASARESPFPVLRRDAEIEIMPKNWIFSFLLFSLSDLFLSL